MIELTDVQKRYGDSQVLRGVSAQIQSAEMCAILGPSGSGKSTLMNLIGLLDHPTAGSIRIDGMDVSALTSTEAAHLRNSLLGFVFQSFHLLPRLTAWKNVALPLLYRGVPSKRRRELAVNMLERVGLAGRMDALPNQLSGGQSQRVAIARALIGSPRLLLADEPTGSLDTVAGCDIIALFKEIRKSLGVTVVLVTHDLAVAEECDRRIHIRDGLISTSPS